MLSGLFGGLFSRLAGGHGAGLQRKPTPSDIEGPFYPVTPQKDKDFDLTKVEGREGVAKGEVIQIVGTVMDTHGKPIEDATVDIWQANALGRYNHPNDNNPAAVDENFQGWAVVQSGKEGQFRFKTIKPGAYPLGRNTMRPPHIHFKVSKKGYQELTTQMYFPDEELNEKDALLQRKDKANQALMTARELEDHPGHLVYDLVLNKSLLR